MVRGGEDVAGAGAASASGDQGECLLGGCGWDDQEVDRLNPRDDEVDQVRVDGAEPAFSDLAAGGGDAMRDVVSGVEVQADAQDPPLHPQATGTAAASAADRCAP